MKRLALLIPALLASPVLLHAQDTATPATAVANVRPPTLSKMRIDLGLPGGMALNDAVATVRNLFEHTYGVTLNIVLSEEANAIKVPELNLHRVTLAQIFSVLKNSSAKGIDETNQLSHSVSFECEEDPESPDSIWYFRKTAHTGGPGGQNAAEFYNLAPILDSNGLKIDDISTALKEAWKLAGDSPDPRVTFHKETGLLVVAGDGPKADMVGRMLSTLSSNAVDHKTAKLKHEVEALQRQIKETAMSGDMQRNILDRERKLADDATAKLAHENESLRAEVRELQAQLAKLELKAQTPAK